MASGLSIIAQQNDDRVIVGITGELDLATAGELDKALQNALSRGRERDCA